MRSSHKPWWNERDPIKDTWIDHILETWGIVLKIKSLVIEGETDRTKDCASLDSIFILAITHRLHNFSTPSYCEGVAFPVRTCFPKHPCCKAIGFAIWTAMLSRMFLSSKIRCCSAAKRSPLSSCDHGPAVKTSLSCTYCWAYSLWKKSICQKSTWGRWRHHRPSTALLKISSGVMVSISPGLWWHAKKYSRHSFCGRSSQWFRIDD